ncbi:hypothetical protein [Variovorax sp. dw_308]|uniref:hypothetical protein n=1 Tax=Variovorax sp. dw_308 TaxID=2721546 RepID=UPI001C456B31|nr:hypothetical protein [Variovorax sp. dw_308]
MTTVQIDLPDQLAQQARSAGLFSPEKMEAILRAQLRREAVEGLRALHAREPIEELTPEIEQEIVDIVREVRAERRRNSN